MQKKIIVILDYGSGNLRSAAKAFEYVVSAENLPAKVIISSKPEDVLMADAIILPGQGAFGDCIQNLRSIDGMADALTGAVLQQKKPFMGICVGMQLLADEGHEHGVHQGLGWIRGRVVKMQPADPTLKIPHMGWNSLVRRDGGFVHPALQHIKSDDHFYFVHSFVFESKDMAHNLADVSYGQHYPAIVGRDNIIGVQFHPEKSQTAGLRLLTGFVQWALQAENKKD